MNEIISFEDVTVSYQRHPALHHISCGIARNEMTAIIGPNGGGKSTFLRAIAGLVETDHGALTLQNIDRKDIAFLPQQNMIERNFPISAIEVVMQGAWRKLGYLKFFTPSTRKKALEALKKVGLAGFEDRPLSTLSSGQLRRVMFARVIMQDAKLILLDEPFANIDEKITESLLRLIKQWQKEKRTVVVVLHEISLTKDNFANCILVARDLIAAGKTEKVLTKENLSRAYKMSEAWDETAEICEIA